MKKFSFLYLIPVLMMLAVPFQTSADDFVRGDCNEDGNVNIADVTCLIDYLLTDHWPDGGLMPSDTTFTVNGIPFKMVYVEGGTFTMGATSEQAGDYLTNEQPAHRVTLSSYYICSTEVTQELWLEVMGSNPSSFVGVNLPVERVSWNDCQEFISRLNTLTGLQFRLPTEAEWEYAARGGCKSEGYKYSGSNMVGDVAWYESNSGKKTHAVGTKTPNELGLYDMSGNVYEWCQDWYGSYSTEQVDPTGPDTGTNRVYRGGGCCHTATMARVSRRNYAAPTYAGLYSDAYTGLRLAL